MSKRAAQHVADLLPDRALGCLSSRDLRRVERHLRSCAACRSELDSWLAVTDQLAFAPAPVEPSPELRERILARPLPAAGRRARATPRLVLAWSALGLALIASAGLNLALWRRARAAETLYAEARTVRMVATQAAPGASGRLVPSIDGRHARLLVQGLPLLPAERQYQLWLVKDGARVSGGVFSVSAKGSAVLAVEAPVPLATYTGFGVTVEPAGGSAGPTGQRVLAAAL